MRGNEFLDKMELVNPAYVEAADIKPKRKKLVWVKWAGIAACFALIIYAGTRLLPRENPKLSQENSKLSQKNPDNISDLPMLTISKYTSSMGYEGYMAYEASELVNANPWRESLELSTLPVYQNPLTYDENQIASEADFDKMREFLLEVAKRFGLDTNGITITDDVPAEETKQIIREKFEAVGDTVPEGYFDPTKVIIEAEGLTIEVDQSITATLSFEPAVSLPQEYNFTHFASYEDKAAVAEYLKKEYIDFIGINNPQINICGGDYNIYGQQEYSIEFFDGTGSETENIINYNFNRVTFHCDDEGNLFFARIYQPDLSQKIGDYPIINSKKAEELLSKGNYITTVPYEMPGIEYVKKVELVYRTGKQEEYYMPYYRFYVELPEDERENGLKTYGAYYVPAVDGSYITNMPIWDGSFYYNRVNRKK